MEMMSEFTEDGKLKNPPNTAKKRKMDSVLRSQFEMESKKLVDWFERTVTTLELLTRDEEGATSSPNEQFTVEEQLVLVQVRGSTLRWRMLMYWGLVTIWMDFNVKVQIWFSKVYVIFSKITSDR